jgi:hypothetical protein
VSERREVDEAARTVADPLPITPPVATRAAAPATEDPRAERIAALRSNEPWWRTAWAGAKAAAMSALTYWGVMSLLDPEPVKPIVLVSFGLVSAALAVSVRRAGRIHPPSILRIGGLAVTLIGLIVAANGMMMGEKDPAIMGGFFAVMGVVGIVSGVRMRRQEGAMTENLNVGRLATIRLPRAELAQRVALVRARQLRQMTTMRRGVLVVGVTGVALFGLAQIPAVGAIIDGLPESVWMGVFFGFWATVLGGVLGSRWKERRDAAEAGLICPSCDQPLLGSSGNLRLVKLIEDEGLCPQCGVLIMEDVPA